MGWKGAPPPMPIYSDPYQNALGTGMGIANSQSSLGSPSMISHQDMLNQAYRQMAVQANANIRTPTDKISIRATDLGIWPISANIPKLGTHVGYQTDTHAGMFLVWDGVPHIIEDDDHAMFPSDSFMTKLRLMTRG